MDPVGIYGRSCCPKILAQEWGGAGKVSFYSSTEHSHCLLFVYARSFSVLFPASWIYHFLISSTYIYTSNTYISFRHLSLISPRTETSVLTSKILSFFAKREEKKMCAQKTKAAENQASGPTGFEYYQAQLAIQAEKTHNQLIELLERLENQNSGYRPSESATRQDNTRSQELKNAPFWITPISSTSSSSSTPPSSSSSSSSSSF